MPSVALRTETAAVRGFLRGAYKGSYKGYSKDFYVL